MNQDPATRFFFWLNAIALLVLAFCVAFTVVYPTDWRIAGDVILALLVFSWLLFGRTLRAFGYAMLATAGVIAAVATWIARDDWPVGSTDLALLAVSMATGALFMVVSDNRTNEPNERVKDIAGWTALIGLVAVAGVAPFVAAAMFGTFTSFGSTVPFLLAIEAIAALADSAGERWRTRLAIGAILPTAALAFLAWEQVRATCPTSLEWRPPADPCGVHTAPQSAKPPRGSSKLNESKPLQATGGKRHGALSFSHSANVRNY